MYDLLQGPCSPTGTVNRWRELGLEFRVCCRRNGLRGSSAWGAARFFDGLTVGLQTEGLCPGEAFGGSDADDEATTGNMKSSYLILSLTNLTLMCITAVYGLLVQGAAGFERHFLLGVLTAMFTCFVHVVAFMYFVVQEKIIRQACLSDGLDVSFHERAVIFKSRAIRLSMVGISTILLASMLGAAVGIYLPAEVHLLAAFGAILVNAFLVMFQYALIDEYGRMAQNAFPEG